MLSKINVCTFYKYVKFNTLTEIYNIYIYINKVYLICVLVNIQRKDNPKIYIFPNYFKPSLSLNSKSIGSFSKV